MEEMEALIQNGAETNQTNTKHEVYGLILRDINAI